jgi:hypothetical protein
MTPTEKLARAREALEWIAADATTALRFRTEKGGMQAGTPDFVAAPVSMLKELKRRCESTLRLLDEPDAAECKASVPDTNEKCKAPQPEPARTEDWSRNCERNLVDPNDPSVDVCSESRGEMLDRVRELEEIVKWKGEHTDALEKNWNSLVEIARAQRDTARERVEELEDEQRWRESENGNLIGDLRRELATERAAHERTKADAAAGVGLIRRKLELDPLAFEGDSLAAKKILEGDAGRSLIAHADGRIKDLERALANEKAAHESTKEAFNDYGQILFEIKSALNEVCFYEYLPEAVEDLEAKLAEATAARDRYLAKLERLGDCSPEQLASNPPQVRMMKAEWDRLKDELTQERERRENLRVAHENLKRDHEAGAHVRQMWMERAERAEKELETVKFKNRCYLTDIEVRDEVLDETCDDYDKQVAELEAELADLRYRLESLSK